MPRQSWTGGASSCAGSSRARRGARRVLGRPIRGHARAVQVQVYPRAHIRVGDGRPRTYANRLADAELPGRRGLMFRAGRSWQRTCAGRAGNAAGRFAVGLRSCGGRAGGSGLQRGQRARRRPARRSRLRAFPTGGRRGRHLPSAASGNVCLLRLIHHSPVSPIMRGSDGGGIPARRRPGSVRCAHPRSRPATPRFRACLRSRAPPTAQL